MSDDLMRLLESKIEVWSSKSIYGQAAARIREQRELLEECEMALEEALEEMVYGNPNLRSLAEVRATLTKLRAQEKVDEIKRPVEA